MEYNFDTFSQRALTAHIGLLHISQQMLGPICSREQMHNVSNMHININVTPKGSLFLSCFWYRRSLLAQKDLSQILF